MRRIWNVPAGANTIPAGQYPPFVFFDGESRYPDKETGEVINNRVFFCPERLKIG